MKRFILALLLLLAVTAKATDFQITFRDSTKIEDAYMPSNALQYNYGRVNDAGKPNRVYMHIGPSFSNNYRALFRIPDFFDSLANHPGAIIDSAKIDLWVMIAFGASAGDTAYLRLVGIDSARNWVEGNKNAVLAADCEVTYDSCQTTGTGTCSTPMDWTTNGASGSSDTTGLYTGKPSDSTLLDGDVLAAGDKLTLWIDTVLMNIWKDQQDANEGFLIYCSSKNGNIDIYPKLYASESNTYTSITDSTPLVTVYAHTAAGPSGQYISIMGSLMPDEEMPDNLFSFDGLLLLTGVCPIRR